MVGPPIPVLYVEMDGTGVPMVKKRDGGPAGQNRRRIGPHPRRAKLGCVFTQTTWEEDGYAIRDSDSTTYTGAIERRRRPLVGVLYGEAWKRGWSRARLKKSCSATGPNGFGTLPIYISPAPFRSSTSTTLANISGSQLAPYIPTTRSRRSAG